MPFLREPVDRVLSHYDRHIRRRNVERGMAGFLQDREVCIGTREHERRAHERKRDPKT